MKFIQTFTNSFTLKGIYENRGKGFFKAFLHLSLFTLLIYFPLSWDWATKDSLKYENYGITLVSEPPVELINNLPDCYFEGQALYCNGETNADLSYQNYDIFFLDGTKANESDQYILFMEHYFVVYNNARLEFTYSGFDDFHFNDLKTMEAEDAMQRVADALFVSVKNNLYLPALLALYVIFIAMNLIYLFLLAGISMSFKFKTTNFPKLKEVLTMYMYAVSIPSMFALMLTFITNSYAFTPLIMNFATPVIMYLVYRKRI
jgi:hypothetical protein